MVLTSSLLLRDSLTVTALRTSSATSRFVPRRSDDDDDDDDDDDGRG